MGRTIASQAAARSKSGCMTCKSRKKKCDEVKPRCAGCRRNQLVCEWASPPPNTLIQQHHSHPASSDADSLFELSAPVPLLHTGSERACILTPQSVILLSHFLRETAGAFAMTAWKDNPFVTMLLPLGHADDVLMHALLALSGAHLSHREPNNIEVAAATAMHYSRLVRGLRINLVALSEDDVANKERLLLLSLIACHYETVCGDTRGIFFKHLRASRHLILSLLRHTSTIFGLRIVCSDTLGFSLEMYTYIVCCNTLTPHGLAPERTLALDPFVTSTEHLESCPTFGALFAGAHDLYLMIPQVSKFASFRLAEEATGLTSPSTALQTMHDSIQARLTSWSMPTPKSPQEPHEDTALRETASNALLHALHIYLITSLAGTTNLTSRTLRSQISTHIHNLFTATSQLATAQRFHATILWPILIGGSCLESPTAQQALLDGLCNNGWIQMRQLEIVAEVLRSVWEDSDPTAYGPYGLYRVIGEGRVHFVNA